MNHSDELQGGPISLQMTLFDIIYRWRAAERIITAYEAQAGVCLRCHALFDTLEEAAKKYNLDLTKLVANLNALAQELDSGKSELP